MNSQSVISVTVLENVSLVPIQCVEIHFFSPKSLGHKPQPPLRLTLHQTLASILANFCFVLLNTSDTSRVRHKPNLQLYDSFHVIHNQYGRTCIKRHPIKLSSCIKRSVFKVPKCFPLVTIIFTFIKQWSPLSGSQRSVSNFF